jgi:hypothetical protein
MREALGTPRTNPRFLAALQRRWSQRRGGGGAGAVASGGVDEGVDESLLEESLARMFAVGGLAGVIETYALQPLIYWKTMSQVDDA